MGWLFTQHASRAETVARLTAPEINDERRWETLNHSLRGNVLWAVVRLTRLPEDESELFIACYLLAKERGYGWGYKDMTESMGPCYYSCPLVYLDRVPQANAEWRAKVREYHRRQSRRFEVGQTVRLEGCKIPEARVVSVRPLLGTHDGVLYRLPRQAIVLIDQRSV